jgi:hypothetical protein
MKFIFFLYFFVSVSALPTSWVINVHRYDWIVETFTGLISFGQGLYSSISYHTPQFSVQTSVHTDSPVTCMYIMCYLEWFTTNPYLDSNYTSNTFMHANDIIVSPKPCDPTINQISGKIIVNPSEPNEDDQRGLFFWLVFILILGMTERH